MQDLAETIRQNWPEWTVERLIGRGAFGQVYQAVRGELGFETRCAIKVIAVPPDVSDAESLRLEGMADEEIRQFYLRMAESFAGEIRMLYSLKGAPHVVGIEDYRMAENPEGIGWNILIRMELLKPFPFYAREHLVTEAETIRLGSELCEALEICHGLHVIHRDIKPQNIFVDRFGSFRLGDFGIARKMENLTVSMSQKGTYGYIAPEVNNGLHYDERADIYSLGLVMYQLTNGGRLPFLASTEEVRSPEKRAGALQRRLRGEELPPPCAASPGLAGVILKACRYRSEERYRTAAELKNALAGLLQPAPIIFDQSDISEIPGIPDASEAKDASDGSEMPPEPHIMHTPQILQTAKKPQIPPVSEEPEEKTIVGTAENRAEAKPAEADASEATVGEADEDAPAEDMTERESGAEEAEEPDEAEEQNPDNEIPDSQAEAADRRDSGSDEEEPDGGEDPDPEDRTVGAWQALPPEERRAGHAAAPAESGKPSGKGKAAGVIALVLVALCALIWGISAKVSQTHNGTEAGQNSAGALAEDGKGGSCGDSLSWRFDSETGTLVISGTGKMKNYGRVNSHTNAPWGEFDSEIRTLVLEEGITSIGAYAFSECTDIKGDLTIPEGVTEIGDFAFCYCGGFDGTLTIPSSVTRIGEFAFNGCSGLTGELKIPETITEIETYAFRGCGGLTGRLTIPKSVKRIGEAAFWGCSGLTGDLTIPSGVTKIEDLAFADCSGMTGVLTVPESVTAVGVKAFRRCGFSAARFYGTAPDVAPTGNRDGWEPGSEDLFKGAKNQDMIICCTTGNYKSFVSSSGYDAAAKTWYGYPLTLFKP